MSVLATTRALRVVPRLVASARFGAKRIAGAESIDPHMLAERLNNNCRVGAVPTVFCIHDFVTPNEEAELLASAKSSTARWTVLSKRRLQALGGFVSEKGLVPAPLPKWVLPLLSKIKEQTGLFPLGLNHVLLNAYRPGEGILAHEDGPAYFPTVAILSLGASTVIRFTRKRPDAEMHAAPSSSAGEPSDEPPQQAAGSAAPLEPGWLGDAAAGFAAGSCGDASSPAEPAPPFPLPESLGVFLQPRSLLLFSGDAYTAYLHRIEEADADVLDESVANAPPELRGQVVRRDCERISLTCRLVPRVLKNILPLRK